jgi:hypothetical protein
VVDEPRLPRYDRLEKAPAGPGWTAHVAVRGHRIVGVLVVPADARSIPESFNPRKLLVGKARIRAVARAENLEPREAQRQLRAEVRRIRRSDDPLIGRALYWWVALLVLQGQGTDQSRYTYVRNALEDLGVDLGKKPEDRVKQLIRQATKAEFLAEVGSGQGPRRAGRKFTRPPWEEISPTIHPSGGQVARQLGARLSTDSEEES